MFIDPDLIYSKCIVIMTNNSLKVALAGVCLEGFFMEITCRLLSHHRLEFLFDLYRLVDCHFHFSKFQLSGWWGGTLSILLVQLF